MTNLISKWTAVDIIGSPNASAIRKLNVKIDTSNKMLYLSVKPGTKLNAFQPSFTLFPGIQIKPATPQNFTKGPVQYTIAIKGQSAEKWKVQAAVNNNPVLDGYYADPDIIFSQKNQRFYIYPTSDGFTNWSGTCFKMFSSANLVDWKEEHVIVDLDKDVSWAKRNAWAPCIIEKRPAINSNTFSISPQRKR